ncbi:thiol:disulfide interchange protein DsbA/DsbL [Campylobacter fetus]|uniref:thiol:disulfide interchange protein DsbA/DsbL n=1 Tax=Campylobacter fetus TaxID=196 RepID=UPI000FCB264D|nr:thiol:disulfide interchange protein DsbA/DsbL [Campylobacter fetus]RUT50011.1 thiol:disulfide interchange protein [Campylobacter fetus]RUT50272.1 thiol:disulfide interchange protein [Campylobacter fetus]
MRVNLLIKKCIAAIAVFGAINAAAFSEGVDFVKLETPIPNSDGLVTKVYSYDCPFCYKYDKAVTKAVMQKLPEMEFEPIYLATKGKFGKQASELFAVLIAKDNASGTNLLDDKSLFKKAKFAYYKAYHDKKERWGGDANNQENVNAFLSVGFEASGANKADLEAGLKDEKVKAMLERWGMGSNSGYAYGVAKIQGVPAFVVDGKYLIYTKAIKGIDAMAELIKYLHTLK